MQKMPRSINITPELSSSRLVLGCWNFAGGYRTPLPLNISRQLVQKALKIGLNHFDTATAYGNGKSEQILSSILRKLKRDGQLKEPTRIASKVSLKQGFSIRKDLIKSLNRMNLEHLDIFYIHWPNSSVDPAPAVEELNRCRDEGLISAVGLSNFPPGQLKQALRGGKVDILQSAYSLLWRQPEKEILPLCRKEGITFSAYSPLAQGLLATPFPEKPQPDFLEGRTHLLYFRPGLWEQIHPLVTKMHSLIRHRLPGQSSAAVALAWLAAREPESLITAGFSSLRQLDEAASLLNKTAEELGDSMQTVFRELTTLSDEADRLISDYAPETDNIFAHRW